jgi:hypothetical protein
VTIADHRLLLWRLVDARIPAEIAQLETYAVATQRAAVDYAIERSGFRDFFPALRAVAGGPPPHGDFPVSLCYIWSSARR